MTTWDQRMGPRRPQEPRLELVEMVWRMRSQQKAMRIVECGVYRTDAGLEVRCSYEESRIVSSWACRTATSVGGAGGHLRSDGGAEDKDNTEGDAETIRGQSVTPA